jgi:AraC-like DNA-binding protein
MARRIERAMALLRRGALRVTEVCFAVGSSSLGTFSTRFTDWSVCRPASTGATRRARGRDGVVRRETGDQSDQESRSADLRAAARMTAMDRTHTQSPVLHVAESHDLIRAREQSQGRQLRDPEAPADGVHPYRPPS